MNDAIGDRMKEYEAQYAAQKLLPQIPACARIDGRAFHTFCRGLERPYDPRLTELMTLTTKFLVEETNANCGYTQSDEISLVWRAGDYKSQIFFDGRVAKMTSMLASMATACFSDHLPYFLAEKAGRYAFFDCRVWSVPNDAEAANYFLWREQDAVRNSICMAAQAHFSHHELHQKSCKEMQEMLWLHHKVNWNDYPACFKRGVYVQRRKQLLPFSAEELEKLPPKHAARSNPDLLIERSVVEQIALPPLARITNREAVILFGAHPEQASSEQTLAVNT